MPSEFTDPKAREYLEMLNDMPIGDRSEFALAIPNMSKFEDNLLDLGCPLSEIDELITELEFYRSNKVDDTAVKLMQVLSASVKQPDENSAVDRITTIEASSQPRFPTGIAAVDKMTFGGGYGCTTVAGNAKSGKTTFAIGSAVEAALAGWKVIFLNCELDRTECIQAFMRKCGGTIPPQVSDRLTLVTPDFSFQPRDAINRIREAVSFGDDRVLTVFDSINALVDLSGDGDRDYWGALSQWRNFAVRAAKLSQGRLAFLVVSETNRLGLVKGGSLEYKSSCVIRIQKDKCDNSMVELDVMLSRSSPAGSLGRFYRDWGRGAFTQCDDGFKA
jgi:predicted ATP-dependent serine protease